MNWDVLRFHKARNLPAGAGRTGLAIFAISRLVSAQQDSPIGFENRSTQAGVRFVLDNGTTEDKPIVDSLLGGVVLPDYDNDGYLDIYFTNGATLPGFRKNFRKNEERFYEPALSQQSRRHFYGCD
jgi:hypothetical protein